MSKELSIGRCCSGIEPSASLCDSCDATYQVTAYDGGDNNASWNYDPMGNCDSVTTDGTVENRTHNVVHELTARESSILAYDTNGNITAYLDRRGDVVARYVYSPFGRIIDQPGPMADNFTYRFSTKPYDTESGLVYYNYRYYSPELGRWMSGYPIGEQDLCR